MTDQWLMMEKRVFFHGAPHFLCQSGIAVSLHMGVGGDDGVCVVQLSVPSRVTWSTYLRLSHGSRILSMLTRCGVIPHYCSLKLGYMKMRCLACGVTPFLASRGVELSLILGAPH